MDQRARTTSAGDQHAAPLGDARRARVLLVEDNPLTGGVLVAGLATHGYEVELAPTLRRARARLQAVRFDLVLLDVRLPDGSGLELCAELRAHGDIPVVIVSGADTLPERIAGFDAGADDYVVKPLYPLELARRLDAVLRRAGAARSELVPGPAGLTLDLGALEVRRGEQRVRLTRSEAGLLRVLLERPGVAIGAHELSHRIWDYEAVGDPNFIQQHISRLRRKLRAVGVDHVIQTVYGVGYAVATPRTGTAGSPDGGSA